MKFVLFLIAVAILGAGFLSGGLYDVVPVTRGNDTAGGVYIVNRFTGSAMLCVVQCVSTRAREQAQN